MPGKGPGPSIKRTHQYEGLKKHGFSKEMAAKLSNAQAKKANGGKTPKTKTLAAKQLARNKRKRSHGR
jgi:hypothetical protein